jgi:hypothetical protein
MARPVHRLTLRCRPSPGNSQYHPWQTAHIVLFIADESRERALKRSFEILAAERWAIIETLQRGTLIDEVVREEGGEVLKAYLSAQDEGHWIRVFPDHFASGKRGISPTRPPRLGESFVDTVVEKAGGRRLSPMERNQNQTRNADYRIDDYIYELKDIQEEGMEKPERQAKLADLFRPYFPDDPEILLDASVLSPDDLFLYAKIVGGPVQKAVRSAADQIKATKRHLAEPSLKGGIIVLNSGYYSLPLETFSHLLQHYARNDTSQIESVVCFTVNFSTNGFSHWLNSRFFPPEGGLPVERRLGDGFGAAVGEFMTNWSRNGFQSEGELAPVAAPISFEHEGILYRYFPQCLPPRWTPESMKGE